MEASKRRREVSEGSGSKRLRLSALDRELFRWVNPPKIEGYVVPETTSGERWKIRGSDEPEEKIIVWLGGACTVKITLFRVDEVKSSTVQVSATLTRAGEWSFWLSDMKSPPARDHPKAQYLRVEIAFDEGFSCEFRSLPFLVVKRSPISSEGEEERKLGLSLSFLETKLLCRRAPTPIYPHQECFVKQFRITHPILPSRLRVFIENPTHLVPVDQVCFRCDDSKSLVVVLLLYWANFPKPLEDILRLHQEGKTKGSGYMDLDYKIIVVYREFAASPVASWIVPASMRVHFR